ncbi:NUDIX hydrolase [Lichenicoccus sp.]|uniref:NUDIX hydrolase n=1 Tax=Lichenicoccus sp. TaxID=2781899 RepID=UPI003D100764
MAAAIAVLARDGAVLLVQRRNAPDAGLWGYPGGKIEGGETIIAAALRELHEETALVARGCRLLEPFDVIHHDADGQLLAHFILLPVLCAWVSGTAAAASDASDARWFTRAALAARPGMLSPRVLDLADNAFSFSCA